MEARLHFHFLEVPQTDSPEISNLELEFAFLTNLLTGPLTLLDVGHRSDITLSSVLLHNMIAGLFLTSARGKS